MKNETEMVTPSFNNLRYKERQGVRWERSATLSKGTLFFFYVKNSCLHISIYFMYFLNFCKYT